MDIYSQDKFKMNSINSNCKNLKLKILNIFYIRFYT